MTAVNVAPQTPSRTPCRHHAGSSGKQVVYPIGASTFLKPVDRSGDKSIRDSDPTSYQVYADDHIYDMQIPGCAAPGRGFVSQRREGFVIHVSGASIF